MEGRLNNLLKIWKGNRKDGKKKKLLRAIYIKNATQGRKALRKKNVGDVVVVVVVVRILTKETKVVC